MKNNIKRTYRLEFNEYQQHFHLDNYTHKENTHGWVTIKEHCTDLEFRIFESFVNKTKKKKFTKEYLFQCIIELDNFIANLGEYNIDIIQS